MVDVLRPKQTRFTISIHLLCLAAVSGGLAIIFGLLVAALGGTIMQVSYLCCRFIWNTRKTIRIPSID